MAQQTTGRVLMVRPAAFGFNPETAATNTFQQRPTDDRQLVDAARREFDAAAELLQSCGVQVDVFADTPERRTPDAVFPNNWLSTHHDGTLVLYPMCAANRRRERDPALVERLVRDCGYRTVIDLTAHERDGLFLEGTGSLVLDRARGIAYAALSPRTDAGLAQRWARLLGMKLVTFPTLTKVPIYHTNVLMAIGSQQAVLCAACIPEPERTRVTEGIRETGLELILISIEQMQAFAGNMLELTGKDQPIWVMSTRAQAAMQPSQLRQLTGTVVALPIPTIETIGGGSARCMIAELHLPSGSPRG